MSKRIRIGIGTLLVPLALAGIAPVAQAQERKSIGTRVYEQVEHAYDSPAGRGVERLLEAVLGDAQF